MSSRVGLFGGSFDPVHFGHQQIVRSYLSSGRIDELWILPTASPPHKTNRDVTGYGLRCKMVEGAFKNRPGVTVLRIEEQLPAPNYTLKTVEYFQEKYPDTRFLLCIGSDSLQQFTSWHRYRELLEKCELLVAKRPDYEAPEIPPESVVHFADHRPVSISSTEIRKKIAAGESVDSLVPPEVLEIIDSHGLYKNPE